ncbi:triose-phosphate isomerase [Candidatus Nomurabacteria bacterium]|nr:triose-phosphate isomerase [Candidatus Nomurabacteria bacterium]
MQSKKLIIGNWKMNPLTAKEAEKLFSVVVKEVSVIKKTEIVICPPYIYLEKLKKIRTSKIKLGVQDAFGGDVGAFTGEVSADMLDNFGVRYTILGHSERRSMGESNADINKKIKSALTSGLSVILCVGENTRDQDHGYFNFVKTQLEECLVGVSKNLVSKIIIAYEPVWAISTTVDRKDATAADSLEMSIFIKKVLSDKFGGEVSKIRIIYGGSVNTKDAEDFLKNGGVDGLLVGRVSLDAKKFTEIIKICETLNK